MDGIIFLAICGRPAAVKGGFTRQSNAGDGYLQPANDGGNLQHQLVRSAYLKTAHVAFLAAKTVSSSFTGHRILTTILKNRKFMFFFYNNYYCFRQNFRVILHWHWHAFRWPHAPASNGGKIITFLPSTCEWSRYRRLHVLCCLLVVITTFCPSCEAALRKRDVNVAFTQLLQRRVYSLCELTQQLVSVFLADHTFVQSTATLIPTASWRSCKLL